MQTIWIGIDNPLYQSERNLRLQVLRKPLGLHELEVKPAEATSSHLLLQDDAGQVQGCVLLSADRPQARLYQMAVSPPLQGQGYGRMLMQECERYAQTQQVGEIILHARAYAIPFYEKLGFQAEGPVFQEVGIDHRLMRKDISL